MFYTVSRSQTPLLPLLKCLKNCFCIKNRFEPFSRGLQGVGDLLFFIKYGIFKAVSMHFSNNCMHAPYTVMGCHQSASVLGPCFAGEKVEILLGSALEKKPNNVRLTAYRTLSSFAYCFGKLYFAFFGT